ncbi:hypothetical protein NM208_g8145 [Fusarium decemcellulare]|uniref:Uncharacterized protein n=1 Tax=Fusarium decemcellulare TaxID=57161 RepID=A0ACC1S6D8_9HYPO|nr:hypothetical protein NM208_g8145 [Fusarium decemcellulare]
MSYKDLAGRTFIVTGAASGMGKATSKLLAEQGANVGIFDLQTPTETAQEIEAEGGHVLALACNVQSKKQVDDAVKQVVKHFGGLNGIPRTAVDSKAIAKTDIGAANMAGIAATSRTAMGNFPMSTLDDADWDEIMKTNLDGVKNCLRAQL